MQANLTVHTTERLTCALVGLLAGNAILLLFLLESAFRVRAWLLATHLGEPARQIPVVLEVFVIYAVFSLVGWLVVGLPIVLIFPARSFTRLPWLLIVLIGAALGPLALSAIFVLLAHSHLSFQIFGGTGGLWGYSILVSSVSFVVYVALLAWTRGSQPACGT